MNFITNLRNQPSEQYYGLAAIVRIISIVLSGVFINNPMITITIRISSPGLIFNPTIIDYRLDHAAITDYD